MTKKFIYRLKRAGLLSVAGIVAVVSVLLNLYQFSVNKKMQREAQELQSYESWWAWHLRAEHLAVRRDSLVSVFLAEYDTACKLASLRPRKEVTDSLSGLVHELISASAIWERETETVVKAMIFIQGQLNQGLENRNGGWFLQDLLERPPRLVAYDARWWDIWNKEREAARLMTITLPSLDPLDDKAWEQAFEEYWEHFRAALDSIWLVEPLNPLRTPERRKTNKP